MLGGINTWGVESTKDKIELSKEETEFNLDLTPNESKKVVYNNMTIRIDDNLKKAFVKKCKLNKTNASKELRKYILQYLQEN